jgi:hypothetical protein
MKEPHMSLSLRSMARVKVAASALLVSSVLLAGPVSSAAALPAHSVSAQHVAVAAHQSIVPKSSRLSASAYQAMIAARGYLKIGIGFSKLSLIDQLTSKYGNGFSKKSARAAIDYLKPNWKAQAVVAAKGYLKSGIGFSRSSLIDQLTSRYGNRFTVSQAKYAAKRAGL